MDIKNAQKTVDNWIRTHGVRYFNELTNLAQLTEEVGEVARIIARRYGEQSEKDSDKSKIKQAIKKITQFLLNLRILEQKLFHKQYLILT